MCNTGRITNVTKSDVYNTSEVLTNTTSNTISWTSFRNTSYERLESFLEATEKLNSPYDGITTEFTPLSNYSKLVDAENKYNGFVDLVITFATTVRLAGVELLNPWINTINSEKWRSLPSQFSIYKVNSDLTNDALNSLTYENDIAQKTDATGEKEIRPIRYDKTESDEKMTFLRKI